MFRLVNLIIFSDSQKTTHFPGLILRAVNSSVFRQSSTRCRYDGIAVDGSSSKSTFPGLILRTENLIRFLGIIRAMTLPLICGGSSGKPTFFGTRDNINKVCAIADFGFRLGNRTNSAAMPRSIVVNANVRVCSWGIIDTYSRLVRSLCYERCHVDPVGSGTGRSERRG